MGLRMYRRQGLGLGSPSDCCAATAPAVNTEALNPKPKFNGSKAMEVEAANYN